MSYAPVLQDFDATATVRVSFSVSRIECRHMDTMCFVRGEQVRKGPAQKWEMGIACVRERERMWNL